MKVDVMFLRKLARVFFIFHYSLFFIEKKLSDELACDAKMPTPYENDTDHLI